MAKIRVLLADDHAILREGLRALVGYYTDVEVVGEAEDGEQAVSWVAELHPDVVLMDINMPGMLGTDCVRQLKTLAPGLPVLMLTVYDDSEQIFKSLMAGATGYLLKRTSREKLLEAIKETTNGGAPMSRQIARRVVQFFHQMDQTTPAARPPVHLDGLTDREEQVLALLAKGHSYKEIADLLNISFETVRTHVRSIYDKLHVHSRTEATLKYLGR